MEASTGFWHEVKPNWSTTVATKRDAPLDFEDSRPEFAGSRWEERIVPAASLNFDAFDRRYVVNERPDARISSSTSSFTSQGIDPRSIRGRSGGYGGFWSNNYRRAERAEGVGANYAQAQ